MVLGNRTGGGLAADFRLVDSGLDGRGYGRRPTRLCRDSLPSPTRSVTPDSFRGPPGRGGGSRLQPSPSPRSGPRTKSGVTEGMGRPRRFLAVPHPPIAPDLHRPRVCIAARFALTAAFAWTRCNSGWLFRPPIRRTTYTAPFHTIAFAGDASPCAVDTDHCYMTFDFAATAPNGIAARRRAPGHSRRHGRHLRVDPRGHRLFLRRRHRPAGRPVRLLRHRHRHRDLRADVRR